MKVAAVCVSHSSRFGLLQRAILNFLEQEADFDIELFVIVGEQGYFDAVNHFVQSNEEIRKHPNGDNVHVLFHTFRSPVDAVRAVMIRSDAEFFACWDDDNLSAPTRLDVQVGHAMQEGCASVMSESLYYFYDTDELFVTDYFQPAGNLQDRCAAASIVFHRNLFPLDLQSGDGSPWYLPLLSAWHLKRQYVILAGHPELFMVGSNGDNWRGSDTHRRLGTTLPGVWSRDKLLDRQEEVAGFLQAYRFPSAETTVCGKDAQAYDINELRTFSSELLPVSPPEDWRLRIPSREIKERLNAERRAARQANKDAIERAKQNG